MSLTYPTDLDLKRYLYATGLTDSETEPTDWWASIDYATAIEAAVNDFERDIRRKFLATSETRTYDPPTNRFNRLYVELTAVSAITFLDVAIASTEYFLGPEARAEKGLPYCYLEFFRAWTGPTPWSQRRQLSVTGTFGYRTDVPAEVFQAIQAHAAAQLLPQFIVNNQGGGLKSLSEADVHEQYDENALLTQTSAFEAIYNRQVANYRCLTTGYGGGAWR